MRHGLGRRRRPMREAAARLPSCRSVRSTGRSRTGGDPRSLEVAALSCVRPLRQADRASDTPDLSARTRRQLASIGDVQSVGGQRAYEIRASAKMRIWDRSASAGRR
jgi:hypothetical protein